MRQRCVSFDRCSFVSDFFRFVPSAARSNCVIPPVSPSAAPATRNHGDVPSFKSAQYPTPGGKAITNATEVTCDANSMATAIGERRPPSGVDMGYSHRLLRRLRPTH
jgi:hypothetical protein